MKILVTGSDGFVGKALCEKIVKEGHQAIEYDLPECDILDPNHIETSIVTSNADVVVHCAAIANLNESEKDLDRNFQVNVVGTHNVARACHIHKKRMVYISTCCAWGNCDTSSMAREDITLPKPTEPYAHSKYAGESVVKAFPGLEFVILRIGTVYGPGMRKELFNYIAIDKIMNGLRITVHGTGEQTRQYVYIDDLVQGIFNASTYKNIQGQTFSVCSSESVSVFDTLHVIGMITGKTADIESIEDRQGQIYNEFIDNSKSRRMLGCSYIKYAFGMARTILWYKDNN